MDKILIKPHHFLDIIKLYGSGLEIFVPDEKMGHDFYKIGNMILQNKNIIINITADKDDICTPCKYCSDGICVDGLDVIDGYDRKDTYNKALDTRIINYFHLDMHKDYTAEELCKIYLSEPDFIFDVWLEENDKITKKRYSLFVSGAKKYVKNYK